MASIIPVASKQLSLSLSVLLATYTSYLCTVPPNPTPYDSTVPDNLTPLVSPLGLFARRFVNVSFALYHALLCLSYPSPPSLICPHPSQLTKSLFTWSPYTITCLTGIFLGSYLRLSAFSALGPDFTIRLAKPGKLVMSGLYSYLQHPSYTGKMAIVLGNSFLLQLSGGPASCWLPAWIVDASLFWGVAACVVASGIFTITWKRVQEEEAMLKETFGKDWVAWHTKTKRFIPGLF